VLLFLAFACWASLSIRGAAETVLEISPPNSTWNETALYSFNGGNDVALPPGLVCRYGSGYLFGVTVEGGTAG